MADEDRMSDTEARARAVAARVQTLTENLNAALLEAFKEGLVVEPETWPTRFDYSADISSGKQRRLMSEPARAMMHIALPLD